MRCLWSYRHLGAQAADYAGGNIGKVGVLPERLARLDVGKMYFDKRYMRRGQRIAQRHTGVGEGRGVQDDERRPVFHRLLHPTDQLMLGVALIEAHAVSRGLTLLGEPLIDSLECGGTVKFGLPRSQEIEVGPVNYQDLSHGMLWLGNWSGQPEAVMPNNCLKYLDLAIDLPLSPQLVTIVHAKCHLVQHKDSTDKITEIFWK